MLSRVAKTFLNRQKKEVITNGKPYFKIEPLLDFDKYQIYIIISERGIGKTFDGIKYFLELYEETGYYTYWCRLSVDELDNFLMDEKQHFTDLGYTLKSKRLYDTDGNIAMKFGAISTLSSLKSTNNDNCGGVVVDEFIPEAEQKWRHKNYFKKITNFASTTERDKDNYLVLYSNATDLNNQIFDVLGLWRDDIDLKDEKRGLRVIQTKGQYRVRKQGGLAQRLADNDPNLKSQMFNTEFQGYYDDVVPLNKLSKDVKVNIKFNFMTAGKIYSYCKMTGRNFEKVIYFTRNLSKIVEKDIPFYSLSTSNTMVSTAKKTLMLDKYVKLWGSYAMNNNILYDTINTRIDVMKIFSNTSFIRNYELEKDV